MSREGIFSPAKSGEYISKISKSVKIHEDKVNKLSDEMFLSFTEKLQIPDTGAKITYLNVTDPRAVDWIFVTDALNFCFWSYKDEKTWIVDGHSGYYALEAALIRAVKKGYDITNPEYYTKITENDLRTIMRSDNGTEIPLFDKRIEILHEVGTILLKKYEGTFKNCLKKAEKNAIKLLNLIVEEFPCFRDEAEYFGTKVSLYKRAQILVADIWNFYNGKDFGEFSDINKLTMFADYRVPQVLVYYGVLSYSNDLMEKLENDILLPSGSEEEVEIRGCSIHAVELLKKSIEDKIMKSGKNIEVPNSSLIDYYLWCYRRKYANKLKKIPFHKTLGIYY